MWRTWKLSLPVLRTMPSNWSTYPRAALLIHFMFLASKKCFAVTKGVCWFISESFALGKHNSSHSHKANVMHKWATNKTQTHPGIILKRSGGILISELNSRPHPSRPRYISRLDPLRLRSNPRRDPDQCLSVQDTVLTVENLIIIDCKTPFSYVYYVKAIQHLPNRYKCQKKVNKNIKNKK